MTTVNARTRDFFDRHVVQMVIEKYGIDEMEATREFIHSKTYKMLIDPEMEIYKFSPSIVFDMWESEKITGDPCNSQYLRGYEDE